MGRPRSSAVRLSASPLPPAFAPAAPLGTSHTQMQMHWPQHTHTLTRARAHAHARMPVHRRTAALTRRRTRLCDCTRLRVQFLVEFGLDVSDVDMSSLAEVAHTHAHTLAPARARAHAHAPCDGGADARVRLQPSHFNLFWLKYALIREADPTCPMWQPWLRSCRPAVTVTLSLAEAVGSPWRAGV